MLSNLTDFHWPVLTQRLPGGIAEHHSSATILSVDRGWFILADAFNELAYFFYIARGIPVHKKWGMRDE